MAKSNYHAKIKTGRANRGSKRPKFSNRWLKQRRSITHRVLR